MTRTEGFAPIVGRDPRILVLGTLPSVQSVERGEYYGNPQNAFWSIMGKLFGAGPNLDYAERTVKLADEGIAVWDVLQASVRPGSLDASIDMDTAAPNDFGRFLAEHPRICVLAFNGRKAASLFEKLVTPALAMPAGSIDYLYLPSTSPAHAAMSFDEKLARWTAIADAVRPPRHSESA